MAFSPFWIVRMVNSKDVEAIIDRSLERLGLEQLHLVQFHWWDYDIPRYVETALVLKELQKKGKILHLAGTNFDVTHLHEIMNAGVNFLSLQVQYSVLDHRPEKKWWSSVVILAIILSVLEQ